MGTVVDKISNAALTPGKSFSVSGKQLSGLTQGATFGDEFESATNYPLVRVVNNSSHHVFYATTSNFSTTSIAPMVPSTFEFTIGSNFENGPSKMYVVANGIASLPIDVTISGGYDKVAADKVVSDKAAAELKAKQEADKAAADKAAIAAGPKKITITCIKGKLSKKVSSIKPSCPSGYKKK